MLRNVPKVNNWIDQVLHSSPLCNPIRRLTLSGCISWGGDQTRITATSRQKYPQRTSGVINCSNVPSFLDDSGGIGVEEICSPRLSQSQSLEYFLLLSIITFSEQKQNSHLIWRNCFVFVAPSPNLRRRNPLVKWPAPTAFALKCIPRVLYIRAPPRLVRSFAGHRAVSHFLFLHFPSPPTTSWLETDHGEKSIHISTIYPLHFHFFNNLLGERNSLQIAQKCCLGVTVGDEGAKVRDE